MKGFEGQMLGRDVEKSSEKILRGELEDALKKLRSAENIVRATQTSLNMEQSEIFAPNSEAITKSKDFTTTTESIHLPVKEKDVLPATKTAQERRASPIFRTHYTLDDYKREWTEHPEWRGLNITDVSRGVGTKNGLRSFYDSLLKYTKEQFPGNEDEREKIKEIFFPNILINREHYTIDDFKDEWDSHPEWHNFSRSQIKIGEGKSNGGNAYYAALKKFAIRNSGGDKIKQKLIIESIFQPRVISRTHYTLDDYRREWAAHPEWHNLSTSQANGREGRKNGLGAYYKSLLIFAKRESGGDDTQRREMIEEFFPARVIFRENYTLTDYTHEWDEHPEWHGLSTTQVGSELGRLSGVSSFYSSLVVYSKKQCGDDKRCRKQIIEQFFPAKFEQIFSERGLILQYLVEIILKLASNTNFLVESPVKIDGQRGSFKPDLLYEYPDGKKALVIDVKLQTTTRGIKKDKLHYSKVIHENYPEGGNVIFLCLNGPSLSKEQSLVANDIQIRYFHVLNFLDRLIDNKRNKYLIKLISGNEKDPINLIPEMDQGTIEKIEEIKKQLEVMQKQIQEPFRTTDEPVLAELRVKTREARFVLEKLAKAGQDSHDNIMNTDFKSLMNF